MSWYSKIYVFVRNYRKKHPFTGFFLSLSLNALLVMQIIIFIYSYYVYTWITCFQFLTNATQITIYLIVFNVIIFMMLWSLVMSIITPTARVPIQYFVDKETDEKIKAVTPFKEDRYLPDTSTSEQVQNQSDILNSFAENKELRFVEVDNYNRLRYCYQCSLIKPDRSHHCSSCGFCVVKYDHHCPWINKCISFNNYKYFMLYLIYGCILLAWALLTSIECIIRYFIRQQWTEQIVNFILVFLCVILFAIFGYYPLGELLVYHMRLAALNETTCEQAKPPNIRGDSNADYNMGTYRNLRAVFGWGLWAFPVDSHVGDGLHFPICYSERSAACSEIRYSIYREDEQNKNHF
ncbi:hypothetical protein X798_04663 [Onchocerca flexuosa]|uniref:Palmitoyltransferase n=1 Tax=Onchocerca flexuosa TaxID=387005 RepID=A0A238BSV0_9BILA|nr:hypothetical protein X798_04663 [Onchocerca flexuosa]